MGSTEFLISDDEADSIIKDFLNILKMEELDSAESEAETRGRIYC